MSKNGEVARGSDKGAPRNEVNCQGGGGKRGEGEGEEEWHYTDREVIELLCLRGKETLRRSRQNEWRRKKKVNLNIAYLFILITPLSPLEDFHNRFVLLPCRALHYQRARFGIVHVPLMQI